MRNFVFLLCFSWLLACAGSTPEPDYAYPGSQAGKAPYTGSTFRVNSFTTEDSIDKVKAHYDGVDGLTGFVWTPPKQLVALGFVGDKEAFEGRKRLSWSADKVIVSALSGSSGTRIIVLKGDPPTN